MTAQKVSLKIVPFKNPSGNLAYRVSGTVLGERIQKNLPTQLEAEGFLNGLLRTVNQGQSSEERIVTTCFKTDADLREAEIAFARLREVDPRGTLLILSNKARLCAKMRTITSK